MHEMYCELWKLQKQGISNILPPNIIQTAIQILSETDKFHEKYNSWADYPHLIRSKRE